MAHYKRGYSRRRASGYHVHRYNHKTSWLSSWPRWWDVNQHTRPRRRLTHELEGQVLRGYADPDAIAWPLGNHKPHIYYW